MRPSPSNGIGCARLTSCAAEGQRAAAPLDRARRSACELLAAHRAATMTADVSLRRSLRDRVGAGTGAVCGVGIPLIASGADAGAGCADALGAGLGRHLAGATRALLHPLSMAGEARRGHESK